MKVLFCLFFCCWSCWGILNAQEAQLGSLSVRTAAPHNALAQFFYRVPAGYQEENPDFYRVLVIFGGRNTTGEQEGAGWPDFAKWADEEDVFILAPGFQDDEYWQPETWSGEALRTALDVMQTRYRINRYNLLFYGYSAGAQCSNLFPAYLANETCAWVSHASGVYFKPTADLQGIPGLITCGELDKDRYAISRRFVRDCKAKGIAVIFRSLSNANHEVPQESLDLAKAFLRHYHRLTKDNLKYDRPGRRVYAEKSEFIGDDRNLLFYPADSQVALQIRYDDRVALPNREVAEAWGASAVSGERTQENP